MKTLTFLGMLMVVVSTANAWSSKKICIKKVKLGERCDADDTVCVKGLVCDTDGICKAPRRLGENCREPNTVCVDRLSCCAGSCSDEFKCQNGKCIQSEWTCDTEDDCDDNSDETLPECPPPGECTGNHQVACNNGHCEPIEYRCDGDDDCGDGTDETGCREFTCTRGEWHCDNGLCVEEDRLCNGYNDCNDGSDELPQNCPSN